MSKALQQAQLCRRLNYHTHSHYTMNMCTSNVYTLYTLLYTLRPSPPDGRPSWNARGDGQIPHGQDLAMRNLANSSALAGTLGCLVTCS